MQFVLVTFFDTKSFLYGSVHVFDIIDVIQPPFSFPGRSGNYEKLHLCDMVDNLPESIIKIYYFVLCEIKDYYFYKKLKSVGWDDMGGGGES